SSTSCARASMKASSSTIRARRTSAAAASPSASERSPEPVIRLEGAAAVAPFCWRRCVFPMTFDIRPTPPDHPQVLALIAELDAYLQTVYAPDENHILDLSGLLHPAVTFLAAW